MNTQERITKLFGLVTPVPNDDDRIVDFAKEIKSVMARRNYEKALSKFLTGEHTWK